MAESLIPEVIPGLVQVRRKAADDKNTGEKKGSLKTVYPIDAKDLLMTGDYELVENGAVEAARLNANPLRQFSIPEKTVVAEVTGIAGQAHVAPSEEEAQKLVKASDHDGKEVGLPDGSETAANSGQTATARPEPAKAPGTPTGAKSESDKK
jgi:hypothetical protein